MFHGVIVHRMKLIRDPLLRKVVHRLISSLLRSEETLASTRDVTHSSLQHAHEALLSLVYSLAYESPHSLYQLYV